MKAAISSIFHKVSGSQSPIQWDEQDLNLIGSGSSGHVYLGKDLGSGKPIAVKEAQIKDLDEVKLLQKLSHENIVKYLGAETKEETSYILLEYVPGGSISSHLTKGPFNEDKIRTYTQQLLSGLQYLHQKEIKHGDIKGANILVDADGCIKLADFGLSKQGAQLLWMAPEVLLEKDIHNSRFADKPDIWSVGCTVIEMATGNDPWRGKYKAGASFLKHMEKSDSVPPIPEDLSFYGKEFLRRCLRREPNLRASASQLLEDPFITRQNFRNPVPPKQRIVVPPVPPTQCVNVPPVPLKKRVVAPVPPKKCVIAPVPPKRRVIAPVPPKRRVVALVPPKRCVVAPVPPKRCVVAPVPPKRCVVAPVPPKRRIVPPVPPKQRVVTPDSLHQRVGHPSTRHVVHSAASMQHVASHHAATQATQPVHSSSRSRLSLGSHLSSNSRLSVNSNSRLSSSSLLSNNSHLSSWSVPNSTSRSGAISRSSPSQHVTKRYT